MVAQTDLGHLIDSAVNNHARFVRAQLQDDLVFPGYDQDGWVRVQRYDERSWPALVTRGDGQHADCGGHGRNTGNRITRPGSGTISEIGFRPLPAGDGRPWIF